MQVRAPAPYLRDRGLVLLDEVLAGQDPYFLPPQGVGAEDLEAGVPARLHQDSLARLSG